MGLNEDIEALVVKYGDKAVFDAFLNTWEPMEIVRDAVNARIAEKNAKGNQNKVRYNRRALMLTVDGERCWLCGAKKDPRELEVMDYAKDGSLSFENLVTTCKTCKQRSVIKRGMKPDSATIKQGRVQRLGRSGYDKARDAFYGEGRIDSQLLRKPDGGGDEAGSSGDSTGTGGVHH